MDDELGIKRELEKNAVDKALCERINEAEKIRFAEEIKCNFEKELSQYEMYPTWVKKPLSMRIKERIKKLKIKFKNTF